ncbi:Major facilitator superfamily domain general substrate transporter [Penicillium samsonianum]|uniref:Major facilitator superfamily domain general substrate transporter n=1 Tax=Penicillium samsonianum TaxID=1882272 RepID=UPI002546A832|nr:Major facilitator superfamily domain general substrate transporter [Penicillium samsonianum]KAJ6139369.1 Major facilitator superfamily domain general substrate transporter [Penicillium samsonianum]
MTAPTSSPVESVSAELEKKTPNVQSTTGDGALQLLEAGSPSILDPAASRRLLRKIDLYIMPLICIVYFLQYLDKIAISYASVTGMRESANLQGNQFNWVSSIFFFGQLAFAFPTMRVMQSFPLAKYVAVNVTIWGTILACMATCKSFASLMVCRTLLGAAEASIVPAWVVFTSQWYRKDEQAFRVGLWFSMCGFAQMFGGYVAYGVATHIGGDPSASLRGWQVIFLILGLLTVVTGVLFFFLLPDSPLTAGFLSPEEKAMHAERLRGNGQGIGSNVFKKAQVYEALTDPHTWLYAFWVLAANVPNSTATSFGNIMVTGMGYTKKESLLLVTPMGAYEVVALIGLTYLAMKTQRRLFWCIMGHILAVVGAILMATTDKVPALIGYYLTGGIPLGWTTILGLTSTNVAGSTKKITVSCIQTIAYTVGNIISPQTFQAKDAPGYLPAKISICILYFIVTLDLCLIWWISQRENRRRDQQKEALGDAYVVQENHEFLDLTDRENPEFRYAI